MSTPEEYEARRAQRERLRNAHPAMYQWLLALFARHDPIKLLACGAPDDEYQPEVDTILPRLLQLQTEGPLAMVTIRQLVHQEFVTWFNLRCAGPEERYTRIAAEILAGLPSRVRLYKQSR